VINEFSICALLSEIIKRFDGELTYLAFILFFSPYDDVDKNLFKLTLIEFNKISDFICNKVCAGLLPSC
jgi:hypothetical protein